MPGFTSSAIGDFDRYFMTSSELIDRFAVGGLWTWGDDAYGQLGDNTIISKNSPVQTIAGGTNWKQVVAGYQHSAAIKTNGQLWIWGLNTSGQLGDNSIVTKSSPVQTIAGGTNWKQVACGNNSTSAIKTNGQLWIWGLNTSGQLGDNTIVTKSSPVQTIAGGTNWKQVACGNNSTSAIKTDGTLWSWGLNTSGQLGDNTIVTKSSPVQTIAGGTNWKQVACGNNFTSAIKTDGTLWSWGYNIIGQLGDNTIVTKSSPVQTIAGGTNWKQVACGNNFTSAIKTDGTLWTWGQNSLYQLGDNSIIHKSSPVQTIALGTNWKQVTCGDDHSAAIKTDGTLWTWGDNWAGQLGYAALDTYGVPQQTVACGTNWKQVSAGRRDTLAIQYSDIGQVL